MESAEWIQQLLIITLTIAIEDQDDAGKSWHRLSFHDKNLKAWVCRSVALIFPFLLHYNGGLSKAFWCYLYKAKSNKMYSKLELTHPYYYCFFKTLESHILKKTQNFSYLLHSCYETSMTLKAQYLNIPSWGIRKTSSSVQFSSVQSLSHVSLRPHESQHARPPCPSPTPRVYSNPCLSSRWCHPTISSSVIPFSSCPQSVPASGSFPMSQLIAWGGQSIGVSASASVLPVNTQDWSPLGWTGWISLQSKGLSRVFSNTTVKSINFSALSFLYSPTLTSIHDHWKNHSLD